MTISMQMNCNTVTKIAFPNGHSTDLASIELIYNVIHKLDQGKLSIDIYLDESKAFDTLDHHILLHRHCIGFQITSTAEHNM